MHAVLRYYVLINVYCRTKRTMKPSKNGKGNDIRTRKNRIVSLFFFSFFTFFFFTLTISRFFFLSFMLVCMYTTYSWAILRNSEEKMRIHIFFSSLYKINDRETIHNHNGYDQISAIYQFDNKSTNPWLAVVIKVIIQHQKTTFFLFMGWCFALIW